MFKYDLFKKISYSIAIYAFFLISDNVILCNKNSIETREYLIGTRGRSHKV
jgi:hypothetical protein